MPRRQGCCGALHYHAGLVEPAKQFAAANCAAFGKELGRRSTRSSTTPAAAARC